MANPYTEQDMLDIADNDTARVNQAATDSYTIHQYKDYVSLDKATFTWVGQSTVAPNVSGVVLQIYKVAEPPGWETLKTESLANANEDFTLSASKDSLTDYKDPSGVVTCRVYQEAKN